MGLLDTVVCFLCADLDVKTVKGLLKTANSHKIKMLVITLNMLVQRKGLQTPVRSVIVELGLAKSNPSRNLISRHLTAQIDQIRYDRSKQIKQKPMAN